MTRLKKQLFISDDIVISNIYLLRGQKVMVDSDLSQLYAVATKVLKQAVRRNISRFPEDFMFELNEDEFYSLRSQIVTSKNMTPNNKRGGTRYLPMVFTEQGVAMLSSVLNSETAIGVNIQIIRVFTRMRELMLSHKEIMQKLEEMEHRLNGQDEQITAVFHQLKQLLRQPPPIRRIGFRRKNEKD